MSDSDYNSPDEEPDFHEDDAGSVVKSEPDSRGNPRWRHVTDGYAVLLVALLLTPPMLSVTRHGIAVSAILVALGCVLCLAGVTVKAMAVRACLAFWLTIPTCSVWYGTLASSDYGLRSTLFALAFGLGAATVWALLELFRVPAVWTRRKWSERFLALLGMLVLSGLAVFLIGFSTDANWLTETGLVLGFVGALGLYPAAAIGILASHSAVTHRVFAVAVLDDEEDEEVEAICTTPTPKGSYTNRSIWIVALVITFVVAFLVWAWIEPVPCDSTQFNRWRADRLEGFQPDGAGSTWDVLRDLPG
jgi:hypothetical protein